MADRDHREIGGGAGGQNETGAAGGGTGGTSGGQANQVPTTYGSIKLQGTPAERLKSRREVIVIRRAVLRAGFVPADAVAGRGQEVKIAGETLFRFRYRDLIDRQRFVEYPLGEVNLQLRT